MFLNIIVVECAFIFHSCTNRPEAQTRFIELAATMAGKKE